MDVSEWQLGVHATVEACRQWSMYGAECSRRSTEQNPTFICLHTVHRTLYLPLRPAEIERAASLYRVDLLIEQCFHGGLVESHRLRQ